MSEELISKKDLLELMDISYGQLYRWKRKNLIPEEWFIKKSVSTGQETFFPKEEVVNRIKDIVELKDDVSLDELAYKFSNNIQEVKVSKEYLIKNNIASQLLISTFEERIEVEKYYNEEKLFGLFIFKRLSEEGMLNIEEMFEVVISSLKGYKSLDGKDAYIFIKRKIGVFFYYLVLGQEELIEDEGARTISKIRISEVIKEINSLK